MVSQWTPQFQKHKAHLKSLVDVIEYRDRAGINRIPGGLAGAIRHTRKTGELVGGSDHITKGRQVLKGLKKLRKRILNSHSMTPREQAKLLRKIADHIDDLQSALGG